MHVCRRKKQLAQSQGNPAMSDTPTPRTAADEFPVMTWPGGDHPLVVRAEVARQLKRELAAANKERDDALMMLGVYKLGCDEQKKEIANLRARLESDAAIADWKRKNGQA
jgi:hypothetical protein